MAKVMMLIELDVPEHELAHIAPLKAKYHWHLFKNYPLVTWVTWGWH